MWVLDKEMEQYIIDNFKGITSEHILNIQLDDSIISKKIKDSLEWYLEANNLSPDNNFGKFRIVNVYGCFPIGINSNDILLIHFDVIDWNISDKLFGKYNIRGRNTIKIPEEVLKTTTTQPSSGSNILGEIIETSFDLFDIFF